MALTFPSSSSDLMESDGLSDSRLAGRRVLFAGINFAPEHAGIGPYSTALCRHLDDRGARLTIRTGLPHYPHWDVSADHRRLRRRERFGGADLVRLAHYVPAAPTAPKRSLYELTFGLHLVAQRDVGRPELVVSAVPSLIGAAAAAHHAARHRVPLVLWVQDMMSAAVAQSGISRYGQLERGTAHLERWVLRRASMVVTINEAIAALVTDCGVPAERVEVIRNWSHVAAPHVDRRLTRRRLGWGDETVVLHSGNMGLKQGLETVVEAARLASAQGRRVRVVLLGEGSQRRKLEQLGADVPTLDFLRPVPEDQFSDVLAAADVLLVNERETVTDMSLPSKLTSYLRAGRPVVAAVSPTGATRLELERSRAGICTPAGDATALLDAIDRAANPETAAELVAAGHRYVADHLDGEVSLRRFEELLADLLDSPPTGAIATRVRPS